MKNLWLSCVVLTLAAAARAHDGALPHSHPHGPLNLANPPKAAAPVDAAAQQKVWNAEEAVVAVRLEVENQMLAYTRALDGEKEFFQAVPQQTRDAFRALIDAGAAAQKKLVDLGVLQANAGRFAFAHRGRAPSAEAVKAFDAYVQAMAAFDDSPDALYVFAVIAQRYKKTPASIPPSLDATMKGYAESSQKLLAYQFKAFLLLGQAVMENGGAFNSRWGLEDAAALKKP
jgi:hypothetical protein